MGTQKRSISASSCSISKSPRGAWVSPRARKMSCPSSLMPALEKVRFEEALAVLKGAGYKDSVHVGGGVVA